MSGVARVVVLLALLSAAAGWFLPLLDGGTARAAGPWVPLLLLLALAGAAAGRFGTLLVMIGAALAGAWLPVLQAQQAGVAGGTGYWLLYLGQLVAAVAAAGAISLMEPPPDTAEAPLHRRLRAVIPPAVVPVVLLLLWQGLTVGFAVPKGIFPGVHHVLRQLQVSLPVLLNDSYVTFVREVAFGLVLGVGSGFLVGVAISFSLFLQRGFLPLAVAFGAVPIVGLAPVLGRAFGVDWESKAAVVVIVTFFPVVLNTVQGLLEVDPLKVELLRAYAAKPYEVFTKVRLPNSLPYLFNALKVGVVVAVISVIVAEFLIPGPPRGLGQRISLSARQGAFDVAFAAIVVSSVFSVLMYALVSLAERATTGWHASNRGEEA